MTSQRKTEPKSHLVSVPSGDGAAAGVDSWASALKGLMREKGRTGRSVERALGWSTGYLSQVLRPGPPALKVVHVLDILRELHVPETEFFGRLYSPDLAPRAPRDELRDLIREEIAAIERQRARDLAGGAGSPDLGPLVAALVERELSRLDREIESRLVAGGSGESDR